VQTYPNVQSFKLCNFEKVKKKKEVLITFLKWCNETNIVEEYCSVITQAVRVVMLQALGFQRVGSSDFDWTPLYTNV
jgi:hypothetical protein